MFTDAECPECGALAFPVEESIVPGGDLASNALWVETSDGGNFYFNDPEKSSVTVADISLSLSRIPRYNGHTPFHYSVAQHCLLMLDCMKYMPIAYTPEEELHVLLHDAAEAFMGDMIRPLKHLPGMKAYRDLESVVFVTIYDKLNVPLPTAEQSERVKTLDDKIMIAEIHTFMKNIDSWKDIIAGEKPLPVEIAPMTESEVYTAYTTKLKRLIKHW